MRNVLMRAFMVGLGLSQIAFAQPPMKVQPGKMKCEDFVALDDNYKPALVYWAAGVDQLGVKETDELVVDNANPVGLVVDECKKTPKVPFMGKIKQLARSGRFNVVDHDDHHQGARLFPVEARTAYYGARSGERDHAFSSSDGFAAR
ncbi:hypothetical protein HHL24_34500 [Paraburkholderia sp. RP-4-7]|uniref:HdeA n=1 Tax=Paraburkholderia polaris TaxID=2728848 RepID=A0A848IP32_9BURK|nr:HdeA/HdeB family chaperone [Paraburkholderia polaris]NMM03010.1 hypothetical protein [Paraburkholderia polaris]